MSLVCRIFRVMDLPIRSRRVVRASNKTTKASSMASACLSNPQELNCGRSCSSERRPIAAAAVQVRSHDGWGLPKMFQKSVGYQIRITMPQFRMEENTREEHKQHEENIKLCFNFSPKFMHCRSAHI